MAPAKSGTGQHIVGPLSGGGGRLIGHVHKSSSSMSRSCRVDVCLQLHPLRFTTDMAKTDLSAAYLFETSYREHKVDIWNPMKSYEIPWNHMKSHENPWNHMKSYMKSYMKSHEIPWDSLMAMVTLGVVRGHPHVGPTSKGPKFPKRRKRFLSDKKSGFRRLDPGRDQVIYPVYPVNHGIDLGKSQLGYTIHSILYIYIHLGKL